jgi:aminoglycoside phosphotransferase (APT) family kinase protein
VFQAARWQVNWWSRVWREDAVESMPAIAVAEQWLRDHLPACDELVLVHGDFRSGNFLFDTATERITAILDWELAHIGDYHQDLGYILLSVLGTRENGISYATGLFERDRFLRDYSARTGRWVDPMRLHFYEVLNCYMSVVLALATCVRAAKDGQNHQDTHATWIAVAGHVLLTEMCDLIERGPTI